MLNATIQLKVMQRLNKLASQDYDNIPCWQVVEAFNKGQVQWCRRQLAGTNILRQGDEQSKRRIDDLQPLLSIYPLVFTVFPLYVESNVLPGDYMEFKRLNLMGTSDCCPDPVPMIAYLAEEANVPNLLRDELKKPSLDWAETFMTLMGNKVRVYTNGEFSVAPTELYYYRKPVPIEIAGCSNPYNGLVSAADVLCEFKDDVVEVLIDEAVAILAGDIESMNQYSRETDNAERNN